MLHFFRKIRHDLIANSKTYKYFKYAIGEILLVVIGILIALYINNQNELKKEREKFDLTLVEVEKELINNIYWARHVISEFTVLDSIFLSLVIDSVKFEDQRNYIEIFGGNYNPIIEDNSFRKLAQFNRLTIQQDSIMDQLFLLNSNGSLFLDEYAHEIMELYKKHMEILRKYDWYLSWNLRQKDDRIIDYYMNNPEYMKMVIDKFILVLAFRESLNFYDMRAYSVYKKIYEYLDNLGMQHSDSLLFQYDSNNFKHYLGKYNSNWCSNQDFVHNDSIAVTLEEGKLIWNDYRPNGTDSRKEIYPIDRYRFRDKSGGFYHFQFDDQEEVEGVRFCKFPPLFVLDITKIR